MGEFTREYLDSLSSEELISLCKQYRNISRNCSRYDVNLCLYYLDVADNIENEIKRRELLDYNKKKELKR